MVFSNTSTNAEIQEKFDKLSQYEKADISLDPQVYIDEDLIEKPAGGYEPPAGLQGHSDFFKIALDK